HLVRVAVRERTLETRVDGAAGEPVDRLAGRAVEGVLGVLGPLQRVGVGVATGGVGLVEGHHTAVTVDAQVGCSRPSIARACAGAAISWPSVLMMRTARSTS